MWNIPIRGDKNKAKPIINYVVFSLPILEQLNQGELRAAILGWRRVGNGANKLMLKCGSQTAGSCWRGGGEYWEIFAKGPKGSRKWNSFVSQNQKYSIEQKSSGCRDRVWTFVAHFVIYVTCQLKKLNVMLLIKEHLLIFNSRFRMFPDSKVKVSGFFKFLRTFEKDSLQILWQRRWESLGMISTWQPGACTYNRHLLIQFHDLSWMDMSYTKSLIGTTITKTQEHLWYY